ncbi:PREDICTED: uncharacterized protein At4g13200, chloroplastic-like [Tarenaya hassleriana]|uniref:uncharacterized protein At4g13200, chloroplastic-like n=1 Tax=Tarenaya hassleriana TaxID=28532 RepID=UPI00053C7A6E|nr:PREDICTED: uncharacterized protein At4g13200, chloroplastic-like [Tarenaya hassleriana]
MKNLAVVPSSSSSSSSPILSSFARQTKTRQISGFPARVSSSNAKLEFRGVRLNGEAQRSSLRCECSSNRPGIGVSDGNERRSVIDAFFLGKALAEVINERIESTVGEVLSSIGRFQAEQQKQVHEIQEEVLERAKRAKEKAAREAMEAQEAVPPKPATINQAQASSSAAAAAAADSNGVSSVTPYSTDTANP